MTFAAIGFLILGNFAACLMVAPSANAAGQQTTINGRQGAGGEASTTRKAALAIVIKIQRADYEGDRAALNKLYEELVPFVDDLEIASRVRYWRGFAKWRRAINGFNENPTPADLAEDLTEGEAEFYAAIQRDPGFADAKVGAASCMLIRLFLAKALANVQDPDLIRKILAAPYQLVKEAQTAEPQNPRLLWVLGGNQWNVPPASVGQPKAMDSYQTGLKAIREKKNDDSGDALDPSWGEPELLMSLAWSNLHRTEPDLTAAEQNAQAALKIVPYWHYVRDILLPQIHAAQKKGG